MAEYLLLGDIRVERLQSLTVHNELVKVWVCNGGTGFTDLQPAAATRSDEDEAVLEAD